MIAAVSAGNIFLFNQLLAEEVADGSKAPPAKTQNSLDDIRKTVLALAAKLGDENFDVRENAMKKLLEIGLTEEVKDGQKTWPYKKIVLDQMENSKTDKDPEIAQRAKTVMEKLNDADNLEPVPEPPPQIEGDIMIEPDEIPLDIEVIEVEE